MFVIYRLTNSFLIISFLISIQGCLNFSDEPYSPNESHKSKGKLPNLHGLRFDKPPELVDLRTFISFKVQGVNENNKNRLIQVIREDNKKAIFSTKADNFLSNKIFKITYPSDLKKRKFLIVETFKSGKKKSLMTLNKNNELIYKILKE